MMRVRRRVASIGDIAREDPVLSVAIVLAAVSCAAVPPDAGYLDYIDVHTIGMLFSLMTVMAGLARLGVFAAICRRLVAVARGPRRLSMTLSLLAFFSSMLITNDVALVTFVPLALLALRPLGSERLVCFTVVMMTIAANLGSMFTPVGNPQNLYLYSVSHMALGDFLLLMLPYTLAALAMIAGAVVVRGRAMARAAGEDSVSGGVAASAFEAPVRDAGRIACGRVVVWAAAFICALLSVAHVVPFQAAAVAALIAGLIVDRGALAHVDYALLATFIAFFIFVGNIGRVEVVHAFIQAMVEDHEMGVAVAASQVLSNVPAALLLSSFTNAWDALIVGTNLGGLGTLIASMASLISYKQIAVALPRAKGRYFMMFTAWNVTFLAVLLVVYLLVG